MMQGIEKFLQAVNQLIPQKHKQSVAAFLEVVRHHNVQTSFAKESQQMELDAENHQQSDAGARREEKVLEIDVIESSYIPRTDEEIKDNHQIQPPQTKQADKQIDKRTLQIIEMEKKSILEELKKIDEEIAIIRGEPAEDINLKRREKELEEEKARRQAKDLVKHLKKEKKDLQERKKKEYEKHLLTIQQEEQELRNRRREEESKAKEQKRKAIEQRMEEERRKREERKLMDKQSNKLLVQLKKEDELFKVKESIPAEIIEVEQKKKVAEKRQDVNFRQIQEHQRRYIIMKEQEKANRRDRSESQPHQVPKYQKNTWIEKIQEEELKKKEEEKLKELHKKNQLEKRLKYGELVKNIFLPKKKESSKISTEDVPKPHTPNSTLPKIPESEKRVTESKAMKNFTQQNKPFATAHNYKNPPRPSRVSKEQLEQKEYEEEKEEKEKKEEKEEKEKERKQREMELRRQTNERLRKLENQSLDLLPQSKPKYENYLGQVKVKRKDENSWKEIIDNGKLSKEEKYTEMLKKANNLETRAKQKEQFRKDGDEEAVNLYIGSIQAKLALLEKF